MAALPHESGKATRCSRNYWQESSDPSSTTAATSLQPWPHKPPERAFRPVPTRWDRNVLDITRVVEDSCRCTTRGRLVGPRALLHEVSEEVIPGYDLAERGQELLDCQ